MNEKNKNRGLTNEQVLASREKHGKNFIEEAKPEGFFKKVLNGFKDPMVLLLLAISGIFIVWLFLTFRLYYKYVL